MSLRLKHISVVLKSEIIYLLDLFGLKSFLRKRIEQENDVSNRDIQIDTNSRSIIVLPNIPWKYRKQRPQQIFERLAKKGFNIFYVSPITSEREYVVEIEKNIFVIHLKTEVPGNILRDFHLDIKNSKIFVNSFNRVLGEYLQKDTLLFVLHPVWKDVAFSIKGVKKIYDLMDLYSGFPGAKKEFIIAEEELIRKSEMVLTTATSLYEYAKKLNSNVHMLRNGSDYYKFANLKKNGKLEALSSKPVIGYFGALTEWLDFDLLEYLVKENSDKYFVLIGSIGTKNTRKLYKYNNVFFLGETEHSKLAGYLAYFDVCIIPFILNELIQSTNPVKFYEYIASGKPVVSVDLPELQGYSDICYLPKDKEEFSKDLNRALKEGGEELSRKRKRVAKDNSWDRRVEDLIKLVEKYDK